MKNVLVPLADLRGIQPPCSPLANAPIFARKVFLTVVIETAPGDRVDECDQSSACATHSTVGCDALPPFRREESRRSARRGSPTLELFAGQAKMALSVDERAL